MTAKRTPRLVALGFCAAALASACGAGESDQTTTAVPGLDRAEAPASAPAADGDAAAAPTGENQLPSVEVVDLATGDTVLLSSFAPADRPIVLWFWAPH